MFLLKFDFTVQELNAARETMGRGILIPLIEHLEFLGSGFTQIFHPGMNPSDAGTARTVETTGFHVDASNFASGEEGQVGRHLGRDVFGKDGDFGHGW